MKPRQIRLMSETHKMFKSLRFKREKEKWIKDIQQETYFKKKMTQIYENIINLSSYQEKAIFF